MILLHPLKVFKVFFANDIPTEMAIFVNVEKVGFESSRLSRRGANSLIRAFQVAVAGPFGRSAWLWRGAVWSGCSPGGSFEDFFALNNFIFFARDLAMKFLRRTTLPFSSSSVSTSSETPAKKKWSLSPRYVDRLSREMSCGVTVACLPHTVASREYGVPNTRTRRVLVCCVRASSEVRASNV